MNVAFFFLLFNVFVSVSCLSLVLFVTMRGRKERCEWVLSFLSQGGMRISSSSKDICQLSKNKINLYIFLEDTFVHCLFLSMTIWKKKVFLKMRRLNRKKTLSLVKELDAFPKVPESYVETSASGGTGESINSN